MGIFYPLSLKYSDMIGLLMLQLYFFKYFNILHILSWSEEVLYPGLFLSNAHPLRGSLYRIHISEKKTVKSFLPEFFCKTYCWAFHFVVCSVCFCFLIRMLNVFCLLGLKHISLYLLGLKQVFLYKQEYSYCAFVSSSPLKSANLPSFLFLGDFPFSRTLPPHPPSFWKSEWRLNSTPPAERGWEVHNMAFISTSACDLDRDISVHCIIPNLCNIFVHIFNQLPQLGQICWRYTNADFKIFVHVCVHIKTNFSHISVAYISKRERRFNDKSSTYHFHAKTKILADFQICISVSLSVIHWDFTFLVLSLMPVKFSSRFSINRGLFLVKTDSDFLTLSSIIFVLNILYQGPIFLL